MDCWVQGSAFLFHFQEDSGKVVVVFFFFFSKGGGVPSWASCSKGINPTVLGTIIRGILCL